MGKLVVLNLAEGDFDRGFTVIVEIGEENARPEVKMAGKLPPAPRLTELVKQWQEDFQNKVNPKYSRTAGDRARATSRQTIKRNSLNSARNLEVEFNTWLNSGEPDWQKIRDKLQQKLHRDDEIRVIIQTDNDRMRRLPWSVWNLFALEYKKAEIALSTPNYQSPGKTSVTKRQSQVKILAVLGDSIGINTNFDRQQLQQVASSAEIALLNQPSKQKLLEKLWKNEGWHILFFAGHSSSNEDGTIGELQINPKEILAIGDFYNAIDEAIAKGLQVAIFNSCDGLGLANELAKLHIPLSIVMREKIPDEVAREFLKHFLTSFAANESVYAAVLAARRKLYDLYNQQYPGISWLPIICQNLAIEPPTWRNFLSHEWVLEKTLGENKEIIYSVAISPDGKIIASGGMDRFIRLWNLETGELCQRLEAHNPETNLNSILCVAFSPDGKTLASSSNMEFNEGTIKLWDVNTGKVQRSLNKSFFNLPAIRVSSVAFSPDGKYLASGHIGTDIKIWDLASGKEEHTLRGHGWEVSSVAFSADGRFLVSGGMDGIVMIWDWRKEKRTQILNRHDDWFAAFAAWGDISRGFIRSVAVSPDGSLVAAASSERPIYLWKVADGEECRILSANSSKARAIAFSPDGRTLVSGEDTQLRIWNYHTAEVLQAIPSLAIVHAVAFSPDGQTLVTGTANGEINIYRLPA
ncbi:CHAT domain-containing protein [Oscillatoria salina]|uniref:CHAT domain-containing protein n=1 Tax=Oscillatoria salina TaxID=331517 RepID=UPI001CCD719C|nr:CHAT domain-containing protein [Oscillatoria salina]MBZ8179753.1 CHAT domain-containing protein [Oscillatoria salina IIICB1]